MTNRRRSPSSPTSLGKSNWRSERNIRWIQERCRVPEGRLVGQPVVLREFQRDILRQIYDNPHGTRRAIVTFGRKNGKTALVAFLLLLHLCGPEKRLNSQLFSAAQSRDQAAILFSLAAKIVRMSPEMSDHIVIRDTAKQLFCPELGTLYRALSADATTAYGLSPVFIVHDELGQVRGPRSELYEALETATGAQDDPLSIVISTQAPTNSDLLSVLIDDAIAGHDPRVVVSLYTAPQEDDPFDEETIRLANPAFGDFQNSREVLAMAEDARRMPAREAEFRNLVLNQRVEATAPLFSKSVWEACGAEIKPLDGVPVYGGLDLSAVNDLTALILGGRVDGVWQIHPTFWMPEDGIADRARVDRVPYDLWHKQGFLRAAPGRTVDYEFVARHLREVCTRYDVRKIGFDRWNFKHLRPWLVRAGFDEREIDDLFDEVGQGFASMSPAMRDLESEVLNGRLAHGNHPVLYNNIANAVVAADPSGNRKLNKAKSTGRIDGAVALLDMMAVAPAMDEPSGVQMFFLGAA